MLHPENLVSIFTVCKMEKERLVDMYLLAVFKFIERTDSTTTNFTLIYSYLFSNKLIFSFIKHIMSTQVKLLHHSSILLVSLLAFLALYTNIKEALCRKVRSEFFYQLQLYYRVTNMKPFTVLKSAPSYSNAP